jgi:hypothetical protein
MISLRLFSSLSLISSRTVEPSSLPAEPVTVHQVLPDSHRAPAAFQLLRDQFAVRFATARRSTTRFAGLLAKRSVITSMAAFEFLLSRCTEN